MARPKWDEKYIVDVYRLASQGYTKRRIAGVLGVSHSTLRDWCDRHPGLQYALDTAQPHDGDAETFMEYVYGRLPPQAQAVWDKLVEYESDPNGQHQIEALLADSGKRMRQQLFFHAMCTTNYNLTESCRRVGISRNTFDEWRTSDPDFAELAAQLHKMKGDFFEEALTWLVATGDSPATIFANKTYNRDRGYGDKLTVEQTGTVTHAHMHIDITQLDLPREVQRAIADAIAAQHETAAGPPALEALEVA